jgi:hypothetical protein
MIMPLSPDEALKKNEGKRNLQFQRAIEVLLAEVEEAVNYYTGNPVYVGLPAYLQYKVQADAARDLGEITLEAVDGAISERFSSSGWTMAIVTNKSESYYWLKLRDSREE